jgi:hypothetical protein
MNAQAQIMNLRRQIAGLSLAQLSVRSESVKYQKVWRVLVGGEGSFSKAQDASIDRVLTDAEAEMAAAVAALAVLRSAFAADSPEGEDTRPSGHHGPPVAAVA